MSDAYEGKTTTDIPTIAVVQLSDIHFKVNSNVTISRSEKIVDAIRPILESVGVVIFAITGDIANSGTADEYKVASSFFANIRSAIQAGNGGMPVHFVFIPGNHDCDFALLGDARPALLEMLPAKIETLNPSGEIVGQMLEVQDGFFVFEGNFRAGEQVPKPDRLKYRVRLRVGDIGIRFDCYNTAWMSEGRAAGDVTFSSEIAGIGTH